jgi:hypothetical protein
MPPFFDCLFRINFFAHFLRHTIAKPILPLVEEVFKVPTLLRLLLHLKCGRRTHKFNFLKLIS